jgi:hypothetical protein
MCASRCAAAEGKAGMKAARLLRKRADAGGRAVGLQQRRETTVVVRAAAVPPDWSPAATPLSLAPPLLLSASRVSQSQSLQWPSSWQVRVPNVPPYPHDGASRHTARNAQRAVVTPLRRADEDRCRVWRSSLDPGVPEPVLPSEPPVQVCPEGHTHVPLSHLSPPVQALPHSPQCSSLQATLVQTPSHTG